MITGHTINPYGNYSTTLVTNPTESNNIYFTTITNNNQ